MVESAMKNAEKSRHEPEVSSLTKVSPRAEESQLVRLGDHCRLPGSRFDGVFLWILCGHFHFGDPDGGL